MSLENIDLNLLVVFESLMAERNVTRAGARIGRSQPAMSAALARLRELMGDELFVRSPNGLQPTPRALDLVGPIGGALSEIRRSLSLTERFDPATSLASLTIGMTDFPASLLMPRIVSILRARAPDFASLLYVYRPERRHRPPRRGRSRYDDQRAAGPGRQNPEATALR